ncbi:MAG: oligosaccharide flippase family protein [Lachnospiraceae bacterium]|nr:oligosaccharide flippase family protein [Agathobacter sp.]MDD6290848.1 oligosaccharide flippase family protein [Lachnospiraceae bacterium]
MTFSRFTKNPLISGTLLMTTAGVLSRIIGFFYRIFLSRTIGAEALGIYQLIAPVFSICFALTASSVQTSISKFVGDVIGECEHSSCGEKRARFYLVIGLTLSVFFSLVTGALVYTNADWIAVHLLGEKRCSPLLILLTYSLLPACIHACINGYYYGKKRAFVPSVCQLMEQIARVSSVFIIYQVTVEKGIPLTAFHAVAGLVIGEFAGLLTCLCAFSAEKHLEKGAFRSLQKSYSQMIQMFCAMVFPLTLNRVTVALSSSLENLLIPQKLQEFGYSNADALSIYGVLTGMTLSIILFPNVLTNSFSVLLLPAISEAKGQNRREQIVLAIKKAILYGSLLGLVFTVLFLLSGNLLGNKLFHNALAGVFIRRLSWLCPLMYITSLLSSILHGLGNAAQVLYVNLLSCLIRISMIWFLVPRYGIGAYLWGMLLSYVFTTLSCMFLLRSYSR